MTSYRKAAAINRSRPSPWTRSNYIAITPFVFITSFARLGQWKELLRERISCVINLTNELPNMIVPKALNVEFLRFPIIDSPNFPACIYFDAVADRIAENVNQNRRTLLYCHQAQSRSVTFLLAYLIKHHQLPLSTALQLIREKQPCALPNAGFWRQLKLFELDQMRRASLTKRSYLRSYGHEIFQKCSRTIGRLFTETLSLNYSPRL